MTENVKKTADKNLIFLFLEHWNKQKCYGTEGANDGNSIFIHYGADGCFRIHDLPSTERIVLKSFVHGSIKNL